MVILENQGFCYCCDQQVFFRADHEWLRDHYLCKNCGSIPRERALMYCIERFYPRWKEFVIHESSPAKRGASLKLQKHVKEYVPSHYFSDFPLGKMHPSGFINQDLENQTFESEVFDLVVTQDVMEHTFNPAKAFSEISRTLKIGGAHIFTVPLVNKDKPSEVKARRKPDGSITYLGAPTYHGNPIGDKGSLVTMRWGYDISEFIFRHGELHTQIIFIDNIDLGIRAECIEVFISRKIAADG